MNCWKTTPIWSARNRSRPLDESDPRSVPNRRISPLVGVLIPVSRLNNVVLPLPLAPRTNKCSPALSVSSSMATMSDAWPGHRNLTPSRVTTERSLLVTYPSSSTVDDGDNSAADCPEGEAHWASTSSRFGNSSKNAVVSNCLISSRFSHSNRHEAINSA